MKVKKNNHVFHSFFNSAKRCLRARSSPQAQKVPSHPANAAFSLPISRDRFLPSPREQGRGHKSAPDVPALPPASRCSLPGDAP